MSVIPPKYESARENALHCPACYRFFIEDDLAMLASGDDKCLMKMVRESIKLWRSSCPAQIEKWKHKFNPTKSNHKPLGTWAGTLTMSPNDATNEEEMVSAIKKIFRQKTVPVTKYCWYLEYTANGMPHIHFIYRTASGGRIHAKVFRRCWKIWDETQNVGAGHRGGYHRLCHSEDEYMKYIAKDEGRHESNWATS